MTTKDLNNFSRNYQIIKAQILAEGKGGIAAMSETYERLKSSKKALEDMRPVNKEEAMSIFNDYYKSKYRDNVAQGEAHKKMDFNRRRQNALKPGGPQSYLYRPTGDEVSGPELYDMMGVDDRPNRRIGQGLDIKLSK